jgi:hypothetical protein
MMMTRHRVGNFKRILNGLLVTAVAVVVRAVLIVAVVAVYPGVPQSHWENCSSHPCLSKNYREKKRSSNSHFALLC